MSSKFDKLLIAVDTYAGLATKADFKSDYEMEEYKMALSHLHKSTSSIGFAAEKLGPLTNDYTDGLVQVIAALRELASRLSNEIKSKEQII